MACYRPLKGWRARRANESGKRPIVFSAKDGFIDMPVDVPCGQCIGCRLERSRMWAVRCMHELKEHEESCFVTFTYRPDCLPEGGTLVKEHMQKFWKRLRKSLGSQKIRYFYCGEYGENLSRPHYHAIIFGYNPDDLELLKNGKNPLYYSEKLEKLWGYGFVSVGSVTFDSCAYVARYVTKKVTGDAAEDHYAGRLPEYIDMSRRPSIGKEFALKYKSQILKTGFTTMNGIKMRPPRYYEKLYDELDSDSKKQLARIKKMRQSDAVARQQADGRYDAIIVKGEVAKLKYETLKRSYEND